MRLPPFVVTEIGRDGPGDDDQRVVRDARAVGERDHAPLGVDLVGFAHQDLHVPLAAEHGAERTGNYPILTNLRPPETRFLNSGDCCEWLRTSPSP